MPRDDLANRDMPSPPRYWPLDWEPVASVYFIGGLRGPIKIGVAIDPSRRLQQVQVSNHKRLCVIATIPGSYEQERYLHQFFARERMQGEWFRRSARLAAYLLHLIEREANTPRRPRPAD